MINNTVLYISPPDKAVHCYALSDGRVIHETKNFKSLAFDDEFYAFFTDVAADFSRTYAPAETVNGTIVLPDSVVFTDTLNFPPMKGSALKTAVKMAIAGNYKNLKELKINTFSAMQNRQLNAYCVTGVRLDILSALKDACGAAKFAADNITFAANAAVTGLNVLNSRFKAKTYLFLDVKSNMTRYVYVFKGKAVAFMSLPFGFSILERSKPAAEDLLLYRPVAELAVLNARERAKAKALTMMGSDNAELYPENSDGELPFSGSDSLRSGRTINTVKVLPRKAARKLPKFMLRKPPENDEETVCENFRLFVKWALCFIAGNDRLTALGAPSAVVVNMPRKFDFLFDKVNAEESENKVRFVSAGLDGEKEDITRNLEMYGGLFARNTNKENNF